MVLVETNRSMEQYKPHKIDPHKYGQLTFEKGTKAIQQRQAI